MHWPESLLLVKGKPKSGLSFACRSSYQRSDPQQQKKGGGGVLTEKEIYNDSECSSGY